MTGTKGDIGDNDTKVELNGQNGDSQKKEEVNKIALESVTSKCCALCLGAVIDG